MGQSSEEISERVKGSVERLARECRQLGTNFSRLSGQYGVIAKLAAQFKAGMTKRAKPREAREVL